MLKIHIIWLFDLWIFFFLILVILYKSDGSYSLDQNKFLANNQVYTSKFYVMFKTFTLK